MNKSHGAFIPEREYVCANGHEGRMAPRAGRKNGFVCRECQRLSLERARRRNGITERGTPEYFERLSARSNRPTGENHHRWKGDDLGYFSCHKWLRRHHPLAGVCELCGKKGKTEFAYKHKPGEWERNRSAYLEACHSCNKKIDHKLRLVYAGGSA